MTECQTWHPEMSNFILNHGKSPARASRMEHQIVSFSAYECCCQIKCPTGPSNDLESQFRRTIQNVNVYSDTKMLLNSHPHAIETGIKNPKAHVLFCCEITSFCKRAAKKKNQTGVHTGVDFGLLDGVNNNWQEESSLVSQDVRSFDSGHDKTAR